MRRRYNPDDQLGQRLYQPCTAITASIDLVTVDDTAANYGTLNDDMYLTEISTDDLVYKMAFGKSISFETERITDINMSSAG